MDKNIGVLTEQGFVAGSGLGFNPVKESELHKDNGNQENDKKDEKDN